MMFRAIICSAALIVGLLAALSATAQSAGAPQPLNLMSFMRGPAKSGPAGTAPIKTARTTKHRHATTKTVPRDDAAAMAAASSEPPAAPAAAAAAAYASQSAEDVQVVSGDELNAIDLAMNDSPPETNGAGLTRADGAARDQFKTADATQVQLNEGKLDSSAAPAKDPATGAGDGAARGDEIAHEPWMTRFWSAIGDGFVALVGMVRQLFG